MWYLILVVFIIFGVVFSSKFACNNSNSHSEINDKQINHNDTIFPHDSICRMFSRKQIDEKLKHLTRNPTPIEPFHGAMCYFVTPRLDKIHEYICPVCGEKTIYKWNNNPEKFNAADGVLGFKLEACRKEIEKVNGINIKLDESEFCAHCKPNIKVPKLYLFVNIAGQRDTTKINEFYYIDIRLIHTFLNGELIYKDELNIVSPLLDKMDRLKELLGINDTLNINQKKWIIEKLPLHFYQPQQFWK